MRALGGWWLLFLTVALLFAGCLGGPPEDDGVEGAESGAPDEERPCHERDRPLALPEDQEVQNRDELRCWGHFVVEQDGDDPVDTVPPWNPDDWWHYRGDVQDAAGTLHCAEYRHIVTGKTTHHNTSVYETRIAQYRCEGDPVENATRTRYHTEDSLTWLMHDARSDGFIRHELRFPLADDKQWAYMDNDGTIVDAEMHHLPEYDFGDEALEAWRIELEGTNHNGNDWTQKIWFSIDARNILEEKYTLDGVQYYHWWLTDSVNGYGSDGGIL